MLCLGSISVSKEHRQLKMKLETIFFSQGRHIFLRYDPCPSSLDADEQCSGCWVEMGSF